METVNYRVRNLLFRGGSYPVWDTALMARIVSAAEREQLFGALPEPQGDYGRQWRQHRKRIAARNLLIQEQLAELDTLLTGPAVLLKGAHLLFGLYANDWGARQVYDIDLLLPGTEKAQLIARLQTRGWQALPGYPDHLIKPDSRIKIPLDLHDAVICTDRVSTRQRFISAAVADALLTETQAVTGFRHLATLPPIPAALLSLLHHLLHHDFTGWKWWVDFHHWWRRYPELHEQLWRACPDQLRPAIAFGLWYYCRLTARQLPAPLRSGVLRHYSWIWDWHYHRFLSGQRPFSFRYYYMFWLLPQRFWAAYLCEGLFPSYEALRHVYYRNLPAPRPHTLFLHHWRCVVSAAIRETRKLSLP